MPRFIVLAAASVVALVIFAGGGAAYALSLENHNDFCASCHTQPEVDYYARTLHQPAIDLASAHTAKQVHCIDCHSGPPPVGRTAGLTQGALDYVAFLSGSYHQPAVTTNPLPDANCVQCHANLFDNRKLANHWHFYLPQWQRQQPQQAAQCISCHTSHSTGPSLVVKYAFDAKINPICESCHTFQGIR
jgi:predicted CXXCH cytochrome family protein